MPWLPILKASLPDLTQVVSTATSAFTARQDNERNKTVVALLFAGLALMR